MPFCNAKTLMAQDHLSDDLERFELKKGVRLGAPFHFNALKIAHEHPVVLPHVSHFRHVPFRTIVKL